MPNPPKQDLKKGHHKRFWQLSPRQQERFRIFLEDLANLPAFQVTAFILFVVLLVGIITGGFNTKQNSLDPSSTGRIATRDYKAAQDFTYIEKAPEATAARRQQAIAQLPPVYDWQEDLGEEIRDRIHHSFEDAREKLQQALEQQVLEPDPDLANSSPPTLIQPVKQDLIADATPAQRIVLSKPFIEESFQNFPITLNEQELEAIARTGFSAKAESTLNSLIHNAMSKLIAPNTRTIDENRERGIYLRRIRKDTVLIEYHILDVIDNFQGINAMRQSVKADAERQFNYMESAQLTSIFAQLTSQLIQANTHYNEELTLIRRKNTERSIEEVVISERFKKGQLIVARGDLITSRHIRIWERMQDEQDLTDMLQLVLGLILLLLLTLTVLYQYGRFNIPNLSFKPKDVALLGTSMLFFLSLTKLAQVVSLALYQQLPQIPVEAWRFAVPVAGFGILVRLILRSEHTIISSIIMAMMSAIIMEEMFLYFTFTLLGCLIGAHFVRQVKNRLALMWSGLVVGATNALIISTDLLWRGEFFQPESLIILVMSFGGGVLSGFLVSSLLPVVEATFGYTTDIKLLELSNMNHPLLRELIVRAPGSYHHSMMVGSLCEAAADQIGCNSLLTRVGAYYHDIGKAKNPGYFAENQKFGENPHDKLKPNMSALIIKAHVKDGVEMAKQHGLPKEIIAFIEQHHGTSLIAYFYHKAKKLEDPDIPEVNEKDYRYPGPKPQTRETAICLLADGIEAASKAMPNKTPARLKGLVQKMINKAFTDGQLDECDLTLKDLNAIATAFTRILTGIYHHRPEYPDSKKPSKDASRANQGRSKQHSTPVNQKSQESTKTSPNPVVKADEHRDTSTGTGTETPQPSNDSQEPDDEKRAPLPRLGPS